MYMHRCCGICIVCKVPLTLLMIVSSSKCYDMLQNYLKLCALVVYFELCAPIVYFELCALVVYFELCALVV
jgi:hypothetical protein